MKTGGHYNFDSYNEAYVVCILWLLASFKEHLMLINVNDDQTVQASVLLQFK